MQTQKLNYLVDPGFQRLNRLFVSSFQNEVGTGRRTGYYRPTVDIKNYNVMIDGRNFFDQPIKFDTKRYKIS